MLGNEALVILVNLSRLTAEKTEEPISHVRGWFNDWIPIVVARFYSHMIHGDRLPSPLLDRDPEWESGSGLVLVR